MSNNKLHLDGIEELKVSLRNLPFELQGEGQHIALAAANAAALEAKQNYPRRTGDLADKVTVEVPDTRTRFAAGAIVINSSPLANIFEHGTQARHTAIGANRGTMPPGNVFIPAMIRMRRRMYDAFRELLRRKGLKVIG